MQQAMPRIRGFLFLPMLYLLIKSISFPFFFWLYYPDFKAIGIFGPHSCHFPVPPWVHWLINAGLVVCAISWVIDLFLLLAFFKRKRQFPGLFVLYLGLLIAFAAFSVPFFNLLSMSAFPNQIQQTLQELPQDVIEMVVSIAIHLSLISYVTRSLRVEQTFTR
jgi:hypothetical protein